MRKLRVRPRQVADVFLTYALLLIVSIIFLFPCLWLVLSCFSATGSIYSFNGFFPTSYSLASFISLFTDSYYTYLNWFANTLIIAVISSLLGTLLVIITAFTISSFEFSGRKALMKGALALGMFPSFMGMTAVYLLMTQFAWPWSDYILPKLLLKDRELWTVAIGLMSMPETEFARYAAGAVFIAVPIVILYFCLTKYMVNGLAAGAVKE